MSIFICGVIVVVYVLAVRFFVGLVRLGALADRRLEERQDLVMSLQAQQPAQMSGNQVYLS